MIFDDRMAHQAVGLSSIELSDSVNQVCPFSSQSPNETVIGQELFETQGLRRDERTGYYREFYAGQIKNNNSILQSSSGGLTTWLLTQLLNKGLIDGVVHVGSSGRDSQLFSYRVSRSIEELNASKKSQYYSVNVSDVIKQIKGDGCRYAFVGVPCFVSSIRLIGRLDTAFQEQIAFTVGLICGHMKSGAFAEVMAHQVGVQQKDLQTVDFRVKNPEKQANAYDFGALRKSDKSWSKHVSRELLGGNWGHALFQLKACDFCDDIFAETADVCFGDAWLPRYEQNWRGTNIIVTRNAIIDEIFASASDIHIETVTIDDAVASQGGNFRHRRDGLSVRLENAVRDEQVVPLKRIQPGQIKVSRFRRQLVKARQEISERSHISYRKYRHNNMDAFYVEMQTLIRRMEEIYAKERHWTLRYWTSLPSRILKRLRKKIANGMP